MHITDKLIIQKSQILSISLARKFEILPDNSTKIGTAPVFLGAVPIFY
jgi:hypothetical protein